MNYTETVKFLYNRFNKCYNNVKYYDYISNWLEWYKGYIKDIHTLRISNGINTTTREIYKLKMAKRVCEDWCSSILNKDLEFVINSSNKKSSNFIQGQKNNGGVLGSNDFDNLLSVAMEKMFALGTSAIVIELNNINVDKQGNILKSRDAVINLIQKDATCIIPISWVNGIIFEVAFLGEIVIQDKKYTIITTHKREEDGYVIYTDIITDKGEDVTLPDGYVPIIRTHSMRPYFHILRTNIANNFDLNSPMGLSIYANATDTLKACDEVYDACVWDVKSGQRLVFMNKNLLAHDSEGNAITPQDAKQHYMQFFGDDMISEKGTEQFIKDFEPTLNTVNLNKELQNQLNILSSKCGMGRDFYRFENGAVVTATEFIGERNDFVANSNKITKGLLTTLKNLVVTLLYIGHDVIGLSVDPSAKIDITYNDGVDVDDKEMREMDRQDVRDGIMSKAEYRAKWYGETIEEANEKIKQIDNEDTLDEENII